MIRTFSFIKSQSNRFISSSSSNLAGRNALAPLLSNSLGSLCNAASVLSISSDSTRSSNSHCSTQASFFSSSSKSSQFKPRRPMSKTYRPIPPRKPKSKLRNEKTPEHIEMEVAEEIRREKMDRSRGRKPDAEYMLRFADYMTATRGSTEEKMLHRRLLAEAFDTMEERKEFEEDVKKMAKEQHDRDYMVGNDDGDPVDKSGQEMEKDDPSRFEIPAKMNWSEMVVRMDRVQKVERGGTIVRYRTLLVGGNGRGVAGFGVAKAAEPKDAILAASRMCKKNIFFVDAYDNHGLTHDLVGKHNSCKVTLRAVPAHRELKGHPLIKQILLYFGITACSCKSHGNRNQYNVVYATFKAIMKHNSLEDMALARGKKFITMDQAHKLNFRSGAP